MSSNFSLLVNFALDIMGNGKTEVHRAQFMLYTMGYEIVINYWSTLAASAQIILYLEMLIFPKLTFLKESFFCQGK
jgi:hypothetical protein